MLPGISSTAHQFFDGSTPMCFRPPSPPILGISDVGFVPNLPLGNTLPPQVIYKPSNQEINYKQNVIIRWLKPPTPPPPAPIIIRGKFPFIWRLFRQRKKSISFQSINSMSTGNTSANYLSTSSTMSSHTTTDYRSVDTISFSHMSFSSMYFLVNNLHHVLIQVNP